VTAQLRRSVYPVLPSIRALPGHIAEEGNKVESHRGAAFKARNRDGYSVIEIKR
jgi:hypothetical protein